MFRVIWGFSHLDEKSVKSPGWLDEGGLVASQINKIPGMHAISNIHDTWNPYSPTSFISTTVFVGSMFTSAAILYYGLLYNQTTILLDEFYDFIGYVYKD